jgi:hypothetical protein
MLAVQHESGIRPARVQVSDILEACRASFHGPSRSPSSTATWVRR